MSSATAIFVLIFLVLVTIPCLGVGWIGARLINKLGRYPSKTPAIQLSVMAQLVVIEVVSFTLLLLFFKILVAE